MQYKLSLFASALIVGGMIAAPTLAEDKTELEALRILVQELDQKIRVLERKGEIADETATTKKKETPVLTAGEKGFGFKSADGNFEFKLRGLLQADNRTFLDDEADAGVSGTDLNDDYLLRRVRPTIEGTLFGKYDFRFTPDFAPGTPNLQDGYINARFQPWLKLQAGKFKVPVSLERLQSGGDLRFVERSYVSNALLPNRDIGVQLHGDVLEGRVNYAVGVFDGVADGGSNSTNNDNNVDKDYAVRIFTEPFKNRANALSGLGLGIAGTFGDSNNASGSLAGTTYRSPGQQTIFQYNAATRADGEQTRFAPQFYYYYGPFGVLGEYAQVSVDVARDERAETLDHDAWQLAATYVLTGEDNSYKSINPVNPFDLEKGSWGAWEIGLRYSALNIDAAAFTGAADVRFANATSSTESAQSWAVGVNWYLNKNLKIQATYEQTAFDSGIDDAADRKDEKVLFTRLQVSY